MAGSLLFLGCGEDFSDSAPPLVPVILSPADGSTVHTVTPTLSGTAEAGSMVALSIDGISDGTATVDGASNWTYTTSALAEGTYAFTATATDAAGNTSAASAAVSLTVDSPLFGYGVESKTDFNVSGGVATESWQSKFFYDANHRLTRQEFYKWNGASWDLEFESDSSYDANGKIDTEVWTDNSVTPAETGQSTWSYDGAGRVSSITYGEYNDVTGMWDPVDVDRDIFAYDTAGRVEIEAAQKYNVLLGIFEDLNLIQYAYDDVDGRLATETRLSTPDGVTWNLVWRTTYTYDASGRLAQIQSVDPSDNPKDSRTFTYQSSTDLIDRIDYERWNSFAIPPAWQDLGPDVYTFDGNNRLVSVSVRDALDLEFTRNDFINTDAGSSFTWENFPHAFRFWVPFLYGYGAPVTGSY